MAKPLDKGQERTLKQLVKEDAWDVLILAMGIFIDRVNATPASGTDAFQTLRDLHIKQGKVDGLREFFDDIEKLNFSEN